MDNFDLKQYLAENKLNEAEGKDLYNTAGQMISQVGLFTQELADELESEGRGNLYRFFDTPEERDELIKISEGYKIYQANKSNTNSNRTCDNSSSNAKTNSNDSTMSTLSSSNSNNVEKNLTQNIENTTN